jgi:hypothetical protein
MLAGDEGASNIDPFAEGPTDDNEWVVEGPHLMIIVPPELLEGFPTDPDNGGPYVILTGTTTDLPGSRPHNGISAMTLAPVSCRRNCQSGFADKVFMREPTVEDSIGRGFTDLLTSPVWRRFAVPCLSLLVAACTAAVPDYAGSGRFSDIAIDEVGSVPRPPGHAGRDVGFSAILKGRSVWIFGDTFLPDRGNDGLRWRSSSWSWTSDLSSGDGIDGFEHALGTDGMALQLLPHTAREADYNLAHEGHDDCRAGTQCGSRLTPWPNALVTDRSGQRGIIYYLNMHTGPDGQWDFRSVSGSVATWDNPDAPATRIEPPVFSDAEPDWGSAAVLVDEDIYVYACEFNGRNKPCLVARVPFKFATERSRYRFWAGNGDWSTNWQDAVPIFEGGSLFSVHYNAHLEKYLAFYLPGLGATFKLRMSDSPEGPWSEPVSIGDGKKPRENWNYALIAHPEFAREGGRVEVLSYTHPSGFLTQETRLVEVRLD